MIKPEEVAGYAKQKEDENMRFRTYLKCHAEEKHWMSSFRGFMKNYLPDTTAANAGIAARRIMV